MPARARLLPQARVEQRELRARERLARAQHGALQRQAELQRLQGSKDGGGNLVKCEDIGDTLEPLGERV
jgi:hypothetical protein